MRDIVDLDRYPLDRPGAPEWRALVDWAQQELAETGMFNLEGFLRPEVCQASAADLSPRFAQEAFRHARDHNIYFSDAVRDVPADHPALRRFDTANYTLCGDQVSGPIYQIYHWPDFARFLAATMDMPQLYVMDDPLSGFNVSLGSNVSTWDTPPGRKI